ncbi:efflux RND transporter permease subunit [bacterium]|nr:efflux RND transporter permease subunit [Candidatus Omnitrophota bacterium]MBA3066395.1 efflux RND transporter permease subunit [bacterium]MBU2529029.1 efflux RND transporter permease subunit [bacterium]MBU3930210.1 efflux RND transporter permease subunit [bacterium]MBU4123233.1 efflux RND transporter permease subunit [bacterium]
MLEKIVAYFVDRHLLTNLVFVVVFIGGIFAWKNTSKEEMPNVTFDFVRISARYPGATAEEVEHFVTKPIEEKVRGIDGVYRVTSNSGNGTSSVSVELEQNLPNRDEVIMDVRNAVSDAKLPDDVTEDPNVRVFKTSQMAIIDVVLIDKKIHLHTVASRRNLQAYAHALENQLLNLSEVNSIDRTNYLREEIRIMTDPAKLIKFNIPFNTAMSEVRANHVRQPAGTIDIKSEPSVTLVSELDTIEKLNGLIIQGGFEGQVVKLGQVADVAMTYKTDKSIFKANGHEAVMLRVVKSGSYGILEAIDAVQKQVERYRRNNLKGTDIEVALLDDESVDLKNRLYLIAANGSLGFTLILILLFVFLNFKSGVWVALGIPFTIFFTMICIWTLGYTINNITLAGVIIVMGMIVDDAIVVSENISRLQAGGMPARDAACKGTAAVFFPVVASVLTTCVAFLPLYFFQGRFVQMLKYIPAIIFCMLGASLLESLIILPGHMRFEFPKFKTRRGKSGDIPPAAPNNGHWFDRIEGRYGRLLEKVLPYKWLVFLSFIILFVFSGYIVKTKMKFVMFPNEETRDITISGSAGEKAGRYDTAEKTKQIENILSGYLGKEVIGFRTRIASSHRGRAVEEDKFRVNAEILSKDKRKKSADDLMDEWKEKIMKIEGLRDMRFSKSRWGSDSGSPMELAVMVNNDGIRDSVAEKMAEAMRKHPALLNVEISRPLTNPEYKISLKREKIRRLSITPADVSSTLRAAIEGIIIYNLPADDEEIDVRFTTIDSVKNDIEKILGIPVENRGNYLVPMRDIVDVVETLSPNSIERKDGKRITKVYADIKPGSKLTPVEIAGFFEENDFPQILSEYPSARLIFEGEVQDTRESKGELKYAVITVIFLIYVVLILLFDSLVKPLIIMLSIPFGVVGVILAFWLHGKTMFGFFAAIGAIGLAGVVVNDSILMLVKLTENYDDRKRKADSNFQIADIGKTRLRAVMLTTLTTVAGIIPTAYGFAGYDAMLAEMMLAIAWGLMFATLITLLLIPCSFALLQDTRFLLHPEAIKE